jgi:hypothetical protein
MWFISSGSVVDEPQHSPFLYTYEGFTTEETPSIQVEDETWRRLKVTFPDTVKSRTREQISCFGPVSLLRRHDYTVDILGLVTGLNYASDYRDVASLCRPSVACTRMKAITGL